MGVCFSVFISLYLKTSVHLTKRASCAVISAKTVRRWDAQSTVAGPFPGKWICFDRCRFSVSSGFGVLWTTEMLGHGLATGDGDAGDATGLVGPRQVFLPAGDFHVTNWWIGLSVRATFKSTHWRTMSCSKFLMTLLGMGNAILFLFSCEIGKGCRYLMKTIRKRDSLKTLVRSRSFLFRTGGRGLRQSVLRRRRPPAPAGRPQLSKPVDPDPGTRARSSPHLWSLLSIFIQFTSLDIFCYPFSGDWTRFLDTNSVLLQRFSLKLGKTR